MKMKNYKIVLIALAILPLIGICNPRPLNFGFKSN